MFRTLDPWMLLGISGCEKILPKSTGLTQKAVSVSQFQEKLMGEWTKLEQAKAGTLRNRGYK